MKKVFALFLYCLTLAACSKAPQAPTASAEKPFSPIRKEYTDKGGTGCLTVFQDSITLYAVRGLDSLYYRQDLTQNQKQIIATIREKYSDGTDSVFEYAETIIPFDSLTTSLIYQDMDCQAKLIPPPSDSITWKELKYSYIGVDYYTISVKRSRIAFEAEGVKPVVRELTSDEFHHINNILSRINTRSFLFYSHMIHPSDLGQLSLDGRLIYDASPLGYQCPQNELCEYLNRLITEAIPNRAELQLKSAVERLNSILKATP